MNAIITGATKGIGKAIAVKLAEAGYNLGVCARNHDDLRDLSRELAPTGVKIFYQAVDCSNKEQVYEFCAALETEFGTIDVLVNNAGIFLPGSLLDEEDERFEYQQLLNLNSAYYLSKYVGKMMRTQGFGHIFTICSEASKETKQNGGSYSVTKSALLSLNHVLRQELSKYNVKVTAILPGSTLTASWEGTEIPAGSFIQPEDIADTLHTVLNLSSGVNVEEIILKPLNF